jgi:hypothetical protein
MCLPHTRTEKFCIPWFLGLSKVLFNSHLFSLFFSLLSVLFQVHSVFVWTFPRDVADAGKFIFLGFSLFFRPQSGTVLFLNFSRLSNYTAPVLNPGHCQYGCALYVRQCTETTYVKRQDRIEQIGDMLDFAMRQANVARRQKGRRQLDGVLHIKFLLLASSNVKGRTRSLL